MRNILLSVVVVAVLIGAAVGGTLADFSDYEVSEDNYFGTGALDLTVSDAVGNEYNGDTVPALFTVGDAWPCCDKSFFFDVENWGQGEQETPYVYIHFKNFDCGWVMPKYVEGTYEPMWIDCENGECKEVDPPVDLPDPGDRGKGLPKPVNEPEFVAECGGVAGEDADGNPVIVDGIGCCYGDQCQLSRHIGVIYIAVAGPWPHENKPETGARVPMDAWRYLDLSEYDTDPEDGVIKLNELECFQVCLGELPGCEGMWVHISLHLQDFDEDDAYDQELIDETYFDDTIPAEAKWDHWPTNAYQQDYIMFDMAFELLQNPLA